RWASYHLAIGDTERRGWKVAELFNRHRLYIVLGAVSLDELGQRGVTGLASLTTARIGARGSRAQTAAGYRPRENQRARQATAPVVYRYYRSSRRNSRPRRGPGQVSSGRCRGGASVAAWPPDRVQDGGGVEIVTPFRDLAIDDGDHGDVTVSVGGTAVNDSPLGRVLENDDPVFAVVMDGEIEAAV